MGKRKYSSDKEGSTKKSKSGENCTEASKHDVEFHESPFEENAQDEASTPANHHGFDMKHFRKELSTKQGQTMVLTQFLQVCLNPDNEVDFLLEYLKTGGNSHEILRQIGENKKNLTLATPVFHIFHLIILKVQSSQPHMISVTEEACRYFLNTFMPTVEIMISENSGPRHRKIILKLLTSIVTLNPDLGIEVLNQAPLTTKHLQYIIEKSNYKEKDNVRTAFVHFMTSFLVDGHLPLIKALLEKQGLLSLVIPGLVFDEPDAVLMFLNILKKNVIENNLISKSLKLKTFSHQVLHNLFKMFSWKGPPELGHEGRNEAKPEIMGLLSEIILTLFTSHKLGLYFTDSSLGLADSNKNQNLYKALLTLKRPWENESECDVMLQIVYKCPDLHRAIINIIEQSFEPQHSPIWERTTDFFMKLLEKFQPEEMVPRMNKLSSIQAANFARFTTLPVPLLKFIQDNLGKDHTISLYCVRMLVKMLQTLRRYLQIIEMNDTHQVSDLRNKLDYFVPKHLPAPSILVSLICDMLNHKENNETTQDYRLPKVNDTEGLILLVDVLLLYNDIHPAFFETLEGSLDMKKLLDFSANLSEGNVSLLKFKIVSLWLTLDSSAMSLKNPMFKELFLIMLEVYTSDDDTTWIEAKDTLIKFFKNTCIFEADEDEIHVILYTLRNSKVKPASVIGDIVKYVLANSKELTEYVRQQIVHFEISDENTQANLDKLFNNLMLNRNAAEYVFLQNKVPSPFIVGCMQFMQKNKDAKKSLKYFLSLYIANLLHWNYSPELTEMLIGDSKLDIRSYVSGWVGQTVPLPETITHDNVLKNISKALIENEDVPLENIFNCLELVSEDESDIMLGGNYYRINVTKKIDSSELLIWSKYLIFCLVRLTNIKRFNEVQQKMMTQYFECIIAIGKKHHMIDIGRSIILALLKNPHVLKIYSPLDLNKEESNILATMFLLWVITKYGDIVKYLSKKHKILKSYQQKNYSEIVNAFVKINKRKKVNSIHTIQVLETIGLTNEDDLNVFNHIFESGIESCVKEDKEPSLLLEVLRVLLDKYSKSISLELHTKIWKKITKLYSDLLMHKDFVVNLEILEKSLIQYLENKPQRIMTVGEDIFKSFFKANTIRKSTSQLAALLLAHNIKFCNIFKDQISRPEILSQRELTLPLGNVVINHNQFLTENKQFLTMIFNEYKSNIIKFLEKPHKAGQIYITCWKFIRKLVFECMEPQECKKLFTKIHKFEVAELSHIHILQTVFLKTCLIDEVQKKEHLINYMMSMLNLTTMALKENKEIHVIKDIVTTIYSVTQVSKYVQGLNVEQKEEFQKVTESAAWQNFFKAILKASLKIRTADHDNTCGPQLLYLLTTLVKFFYKTDNEDIVTLFEMVTSHSEFLNVMLSHHSTDIKSRVIEFLFTLMALNKSVMKTQQIPVYLSAYHATRSACDRMLLTVLHYYERNGLPVNEYKPYVWGDSAANHYAVRKNRTSSLWAHPTPNQVLNLFERDILDRTITHFPVTQRLDYYYELPSNIDMTNRDMQLDNSVKTALLTMSTDNMFKPQVVKDNESALINLVLKSKYDGTISDLKTRDLVHESHMNEDEGVYDPLFVFPLLSHLLAPGSAASCFKLLRTGLLSVPIVALSSHCPLMRAAAYHVLHRFCMLLETETRHKNDKFFLTDFMSTLRQSLSTAIQNGEETMEDLRNPRLPAVGALYLAKALRISTASFDPLYKPVNNFFIAKQVVDLTVVPDFLSLFHDSDVESSERRSWILDIIRDGTKTMTDVNVIFKTMCLKMIMDFSSSVLTERKMQEKILNALASIVAIPRAFEILVEGYGLISWLHSIVRQMKSEAKALVKPVSNLIECMLQSMLVNSFARNLNTVSKNGKPIEFSELKVNKDLENEILIILYDLLQHIDSLECEDVNLYVNVYKLFSKRAIKLLSKKQILNLINKTAIFHNDNEGVNILKRSIENNNDCFLKSKNLQTDESLVRLTSVVRNFLA